MAMECEYCGTRREAVDRFCRWCGLPLPSLDAPLSAASSGALVPVVPRRELAPIRAAEAAKGAAALAVSLGLAALRYEPTRQMILRGLTALVESRARTPQPIQQQTPTQVVEVSQVFVTQIVITNVNGDPRR